VLAHYRKAGEYPASFDDVPELKRVKKGRIDPFSGKEFVYKKTVDGFTLYSFADDLDDDGGRHDPRWARGGDGDYVFWPVQRKDE
jgi:hypothetical protein